MTGSSRNTAEVSYGEILHYEVYNAAKSRIQQVPKERASASADESGGGLGQTLSRRFRVPKAKDGGSELAVSDVEKEVYRGKYDDSESFNRLQTTSGSTRRQQPNSVGNVREPLLRTAVRSQREWAAFLHAKATRARMNPRAVRRRLRRAKDPHIRKIRYPDFFQKRVVSDRNPRSVANRQRGLVAALHAKAIRAGRNSRTARRTSKQAKDPRIRKTPVHFFRKYKVLDRNRPSAVNRRRELAALLHAEAIKDGRTPRVRKIPVPNLFRKHKTIVFREHVFGDGNPQSPVKTRRESIALFNARSVRAGRNPFRAQKAFEYVYNLIRNQAASYEYVAEGDDATQRALESRSPPGIHRIPLIRKYLGDPEARLASKTLLHIGERLREMSEISPEAQHQDGPPPGDSQTRLVQKYPAPIIRRLRSVFITKHEPHRSEPQVKTNDALWKAQCEDEEIYDALSKSQCEDEDIYNTLEFLLDEYRDYLPSGLNVTGTEKRDFMSSRRSTPQNSLSSFQYSGSRPSLNSSRTSNRQNLGLSSMMFSTRHPRVENRLYSTAASQSLQADVPINPPITETTPDKLAKGRSGGIRSALRLWQEQHDIALANTLGRPPSNSPSDTRNLLTQSGEDDSHTFVSQDEEVNDHDDISVESDEPTPDIFAHQVFLRRGDLVELVAALEPILAVFVRNVAEQCQFYTIRGEWVSRLPAGARWAVSRFVDPDDLNEILPYLPADEVAEEKMNRLHPIDIHAPRDAGAKIIKQMTLFHQAADTVFRKHAERISRLYDIIAPSEGSTDRIYMSLKDIAMKILMIKDPSELTQPMMWTIHRAIAQCQNILWNKMTYRQNPIYEIHPRQGLEDIYKVREWVRDYQENVAQETTNQPVASSHDSALMASTRSLNPVANFVQKARSAIQQSRQTRHLSKSGFIGPSSIRFGSYQNSGMTYREIRLQKFDHNDRTIIHYLDTWAMSGNVNAYTNLGSLGPMILRAIGMYEGFELDQSTGFTLLQELGIVTPWENRIVYKIRGLKLPGHDGGLGEVSRLLLDARAETRDKDFELKDSMEGLRRDWSDMPVFCIDSAETQERDDGVSLELIDNDPSTFWVHIHVADPSAFITPDSALAKYAASLAQSVYFPERKYFMLDPSLTRTRFSLANDRPCITFSAKIMADGEVLEKKITPGIVRNVHYYTPQMVSQGLGLTKADEESETVSILTVGERMPQRSNESSDQTSQGLSNPEHVKALQKLLELGEGARRKRVQGGAPDFNSASRFVANVHPLVYDFKIRSQFSAIENQSIRQIQGDPTITLTRTTESFGQVAKMVSDLMVIAGDVGASWCSERNIPIPYRGILRNLEPASPPEDFKRQVLDPKIAKYGHPDQADLRRYMRLVGQAQTSDRPLPHLTLGLPAYCKATSPLRRYIDLYAHWQIEAAIRHEAATGSSLVGSTDDSYLPFSRAQVEEFAAGAIQRERTVSLAMTASICHWICQALFRAFHFKEAPLPETFLVRTVEGVQHGYHPGWSYLWNLKVQLVNSEAVARAGGGRPGDVWEARLEKVDPYLLWIWMVPVRLVEREEDGDM